MQVLKFFEESPFNSVVFETSDPRRIFAFENFEISVKLRKNASKGGISQKHYVCLFRL